MSSKKQLDALGERMKGFESLQTNVKLIPGLPLYIRLDGRGFSRFTASMERPYDERLSNLMQATTQYLVKEFNASLGYVQSDEISLVLKNEYESPCLFEGKIQKLVSTIASSATAFFNSNFSVYFPNKLISDFSSRLPTFDCRLFNLPSWGEVSNTFLWRYLDAMKNSKQMLAQHYFSHKDLQNLNGNQLVDKLKVEKKIIWSDYPDFFKCGVFFARELYEGNQGAVRSRIAVKTLDIPFHLATHEERICIVKNE